MNHPPPPHPAEVSIHQALKRVEDYVRREPTKSVVAALGAGLLLNLLPPRLLAEVTASVATRLLPPVLLGLGVLKVFEICCETDASKSR